MPLIIIKSFTGTVCVCMCVCEREREREIRLFFPCSPQSGDDSSEEEEGEVDSDVEFPRRQR